MLNYPAFQDGKFCEVKDLKVSILDLGFIHSDATYDVISVKGGLIQNLQAHLTRFQNSCNSWRLNCPDMDELTAVLVQLVSQAPTKDLLLWVCVTRGMPATGNPRALDKCVGSFMAYAKPYFGFNPINTATVCLARQTRNTAIDQTMKNFAWNDLTLAQWEALDRGFDTAILTDNTGIITEGPGFNVGFISHDGFVYAPKRNCLRGTVMNQVAQLCNDHGKNFMYADFTEYELTYESTAMFLTSTAGNVITVSQFEQKKFKENETLKWLQANLQ